GKSGTVELRRAEAGATPTAPSTPPAAAPKAAPGDPVSGEWDATADAQGTEVPFTLKLTLAAGKVTGESSSAMGTAPLSDGTFANDKLNFTLAIPQGKLTFTPPVKHGKITI